MRKDRFLGLILFIFLVTLKGLHAQTINCPGPTLNIPVNGEVIVNEIKVTTVSTGNVVSFNDSYPTCGGRLSEKSLWVGRTAPLGPSEGTEWAVTFLFDEPVNNLIFILGATGEVNNQDFVFNSNGGAVSIFSDNSCYSTIIDNAIFSGSGAQHGGGGGLFEIHAPTAYTQLTVSGLGGDGGSLLSICTASIVSALKISSIHPSTQTVCKNTVPTPITVSVLSSDSEVLSYQWFKNSVDSNMGGTIINGANTNTFIPPASSSSKTDYYYATVTSSEGSKNSPTAKVITTDCLCYKPGITEVSKKSLDSKMGISSLNKGKDVVGSDHWPLTRKGAWLVLESKFKGLVVNRVQFNSLGNPVGIPPSDFVEGMIVYDMTDNCLKIYTSIDEGATFAWRCINTQACPDRIGG